MLYKGGIDYRRATCIAVFESIVGYFASQHLLYMLKNQDPLVTIRNLWENYLSYMQGQ